MCQLMRLNGLSQTGPPYRYNAMPKPRNRENKGLPARWKQQHGAYYYRVPPGMEKYWGDKQMFRLGKTLPEAYREWAKRIDSLDKANNIGQLLDRYALEVVPTKAPYTQRRNASHIKRIRAVFGHVPLSSIEPKDIYKYADKRGSKVEARQEIAVLSHAFTKAVEWGYINRHPFKGEVRLQGNKSRTRYVEDWEVVECLSLEPMYNKGSVKAIQAYIQLKLLTGLRQGDLLRLTMAMMQDDGIHITPRKTQTSSGKQTIYEWSDELRAAVQMAKDARPVHVSPFLFCNKRGKCYVNENGIASGWSSMWQRFMGRVLKETKVKERFTEHDLRAKVASDAENIDHARALLSHATSNITQRVYRRKPEKVKPLR